jgi:hypothetical protein
MKSLLALTSIKWQVIAIFIIAWNLLLLAAMRLNGWRNRFEDPRSLAIVGLACFALASFSALVVWSPSFRNQVTSARRRALYEPSPFVLLLVVAVLLGAAVVSFALGFRL